MTQSTTPARSVVVEVEYGLITVTPDDWPEPETAVATQTLVVLGGTLTQRPDAAPTALPRAVVIEPAAALLWLSAVFGEAVAEAVRTTAAAASDKRVTVMVAGEDVSLLNAIGGLARAQWYRRWWPSGDRGDPATLPTLNPAVLELDLGLLEWECGVVLESDEAATAHLGRSTGVLLALLGRAKDLTGTLRAHVDGRLAQALDATLDSVDEPEADIAALAAAREESTAADAAVTAAVADFDRSWAELDARDEVQAAVAGDTSDDGAAVRLATVDWALVPARSVSGRELNTTLEATETSGGLRLAVRVEAGDAPVPALVAWVHAAPRNTLAARIELPLVNGRYVGAGFAPVRDLADLDRLNVHVAAMGLGPSPFRPQDPLPWLNPLRDQQAAERSFVRGVLRTRLAEADAGTGSPLLCEVDL